MDLIVIKPRGFCAGVTRALEIIDQVIEKYPTPIYVHHFIVHNAHIIKRLQKKGVMFIEDITLVPEKAVLLISAHGCSPEVKRISYEKEIKIIDATCPLVEKIHASVRRFAQKGYEIIIIGKEKHAEVMGIVGEVPEVCTVVYSEEDVHKLKISSQSSIFYVFQTTLNDDHVRVMTKALLEKYPSAQTLASSSVCYATRNRQNALKKVLEEVDRVLVIGDPVSSNANSLIEVAKNRGVKAYLIDSSDSLDLSLLQGAARVAITSAASTPEEVFQTCVVKISQSIDCHIYEREEMLEEKVFAVPSIA
ncbi:MAG: 4-hydroxy-3-methylbut-2-enyl diphosphate reductase [Parachlamydiales bacterium]|nr:4-hydroxy-3-methylbut-2-enyl diphosphate reductase [Parachlamydiales bacterium]